MRFPILRTVSCFWVINVVIDRKLIDSMNAASFLLARILSVVPAGAVASSSALVRVLTFRVGLCVIVSSTRMIAQDDVPRIESENCKIEIFEPSKSGAETCDKVRSPTICKIAGPKDGTQMSESPYQDHAPATIRFQIEDGRRIPFFQIQNIIVERHLREIGASAFSTYCVIAKFANAATQMSWPSLKAISALSGLSRNTVRGSIDILIKARLISARRQESRADERLVFTLLEPPGSTIDRGEGQPLTGRGSTIDPKQDEKNKTKTTKTNKFNPQRKTARCVDAGSLITLAEQVGIDTKAKNNVGLIFEISKCISSPEEFAALLERFSEYHPKRQTAGCGRRLLFAALNFLHGVDESGLQIIA